MARVFDDEMDKERAKQRAMEFKGYKKCNYCNEMFWPKHDDLTCGECWQKIMDKD